MTDILPIESPSASAREETPQVEIHKPKPVHNWREFLTELGTIVLGICIAITLEQLVESWRWHSDVGNARKALHAEIAANEATFFAVRLSYAPCLDRQVREAETILADLEAHRPPGRFTTFHYTNGAPATNAEWEAQRAAQTLTHFPEGEIAMLGRYYAWLGDFKNWVVREGDVWSELAVLRNPPGGLGPSDFMRLRGDLNAARRFGGLINRNAARVLLLSRALGVPPVPTDVARQRLYCTTSEEEFVASRYNRRSIDP